ncbi:uncharacterized protein BO80DRAFT_36558 [Aspergillus ibericus CBS 121593]|uniref:Uncharacterized protein n=1 Tax=Aspergillus ibericus CBS 121593 TaxID=1448316 RepID=A0A395H4E7_9EURO|nr:hypothetical protein BO80DRAFT_36558 [Aspergillus ibericus CBS 121593]RAL02503.1 hypothetical protein BO80DRAFT_36558 [Aspergillus ibericus CBS 121593]
MQYASVRYMLRDGGDIYLIDQQSYAIEELKKMNDNFSESCFIRTQMKARRSQQARVVRSTFSRSILSPLLTMPADTERIAFLHLRRSNPRLDRQSTATNAACKSHCLLILWTMVVPIRPRQAVTTNQHLCGPCRQHSGPVLEAEAVDKTSSSASSIRSASIPHDP